MLWTIFVILLILWALGMVSSYTLIHILLSSHSWSCCIQGRRPI